MMKENVKNYLKEVLTIRLKLPDRNINKTNISTEKDYALFCNKEDKSLSKLIYYGIVDYAANDFEIEKTEFKLEYLSRTRIKLDRSLKEGFYGEVLLNLVLQYLFETKKVISKGYFYSTLENSEPKGYDCYHFVENGNGKIEFWFGEVKMHKTIGSGLRSVLKSINKALSKDYMDNNMLAIVENIRNLDKNLSRESLDLLEKLKSDQVVNPFQILIGMPNSKIKIIYPIMLIYDSKKPDFEEEIFSNIEYINNKLEESEIDINEINKIEAEILFIFLPINNSLKTKGEVLEWIEKKEPLI